MPRYDDRLTATTRSLVHRDTATRTGREGTFWRPFHRSLAPRIMAAAERYDRLGRIRQRATRQRGRNGPLGAIALDVLRYLLSRIDPRNGRLDPAISTIALATGHAGSAVAAALARLKAHGFLAWLRRYVPTERQGQRGPQVRQASNAYRIMLPAALLAWLCATPPDDDSHRRTLAQADAAAMVQALPLDEQVMAGGGDPATNAILARMARHFMART